MNDLTVPQMNVDENNFLNTPESETDIFSGEDGRRIELSQTLREQLLTKLLKPQGELILPETKGSQEFVLGLLDGLDRASINKIKVKSDNSNGKKLAESGLLIAHMLRQKINGGSLPSASPRNLSISTSISDSEIVKDETHIGLQVLKIEDFLKDE